MAWTALLIWHWGILVSNKTAESVIAVVEKLIVLMPFCGECCSPLVEYLNEI